MRLFRTPSLDIVAIYGISADSEILFPCSLQKLFLCMIFDCKYISIIISLTYWYFKTLALQFTYCLCYCVGQYAERSAHCLIRGNIPLFSWKAWIRPWNISFKKGVSRPRNERDNSRKAMGTVTISTNFLYHSFAPCLESSVSLHKLERLKSKENIQIN